MFGIGDFLKKEAEYWATGGQGYQTKNSSPVAVIDKANQVDLSNLATLERTAEKESKSVATEANTPISVKVENRYKANLDKAFDIIEGCQMWGKFEGLVKEIVQNDNHPVFLERPNCPAFTQVVHQRMPNGTLKGVPGRYTITVRGKNLDDSPEDIAFGLLHEYYHIYLCNTNQSTLDLAEEKKCDNFADQTLRQHGYKHTVTSAY